MRGGPRRCSAHPVLSVLSSSYSDSDSEYGLAESLTSVMPVARIAEYGVHNKNFPVAWNEIEFLDVQRYVDVPAGMDADPRPGLSSSLWLTLVPAMRHVSVLTDASWHVPVGHVALLGARLVTNWILMCCAGSDNRTSCTSRRQPMRRTGYTPTGAAQCCSVGHNHRLIRAADPADTG